MISIAIILFFVLGVVLVYALIQTGKNYAMLLIIIPLFLVACIYTGYSIYILQGTPRNGIPEGEVEVLFVEMQKPNIIFLARSKAQGADPVPTYYIIEYNDENKKTMQKVQQQLERGIPSTGEFEAINPGPRGLQPPQGEYKFDQIRRDALPPKSAAINVPGVDPGFQSRMRPHQ